MSPLAIQSVYASLLATGLSAATVRRATSVLHAALADAVSAGLIMKNPVDNTKKPLVPKYHPTVLPEEQVMRYLDDAYETATPGAHAVYVTAATCGMRIGELLGCPETAVDLPNRLLHVHQTLIRAGREPEFGKPKTEQGRRTITLPDVAVHAIQRALRWKKEQRLRLGPKFRDAGMLFCGPYGRPIFLSNLHRRDHLPRLRRLGLPHTRIHDLRHFHATFLIAHNVDPRTVSDRLGHSNSTFTVNTYVHPAEQAQRRAASMADAMFARTDRTAR